MQLAETGSCYSDPTRGSTLDDLCTYIGDHTHSRALVVLTSRVVWPLVIMLVLLLSARALRRAAERGLERTSADAQVHTLVHHVLVIVGLVVAIFGALWTAGVDLGIFLTVGGLTSLVVGLAFQDLLRNVLAGIFLLVERPFRIGDLITVGDQSGVVQNIQLRTTALRLVDGRLAVIPNLDAFSNVVINASAYERRMFTVSLWLPVGADLDAALRAVRHELEATPEAADEPPTRVQPTVDIDGGVTLQCQYWLDYRRHDPDAVAASLVRRVYAAVSGDGTARATAPRQARTPRPRARAG